MDSSELFKEHLKFGSKDNAEKDQNNESDSRKKKCECGYDPHKSNSSFDWKNILVSSEECPIKTALSNHISFPSFDLMTELDDPSMIYYDFDDYGTLSPSRHWASLIEINQNISYMRPGLTGWTQFGEKVVVHFYHDNGEVPITFSWSDIKKGNTIAILYAERKTFLDLTQGIRQEILETCYIFNGSMDEVKNEAQLLLKNADLKQKPNNEECFGCGSKSQELKQCGNCHLAKYCSTVC